MTGESTEVFAALDTLRQLGIDPLTGEALTPPEPPR
jgi:hypothetical protein